jgi:hypothetical protein
LWATVALAEVTTNERFPIAPFLVDVPCANGGAGETLDLQGNLHVLLTSTVNGNNVSGKFHFQPQGVSGTGLVTGDTYRATGVTQGTFKGSLQNGQFTETLVNNFRMIGPGPGNNLLVHDVFHITINANGDVTVEHELLRVDCK